MFRITKKKLLRYVLLPNLCLFIALAVYFPGAQLPIALTLATGIQRSSLQKQIDHCEEKAIHSESFTDEEIKFLHNLYTCLILGINGAVFIDNGLGEYLTHLGIAKSFLAYAEWDEVTER